jgi:hypothetical protein
LNGHWCLYCYLALPYLPPLLLLEIKKKMENFLLARGFRKIKNTELYKIDLPTKGTSLVTDLFYNLWMESWEEDQMQQSVAFGKYNERDFKQLLDILLK